MEETKQELIEPKSFIKADPSFLVDKIEYQEPSEQELKLLEGTRNPKQQLEAEEKEEPIHINERKIFIDMIKVIALIETGHTPLDNPSNFYTKEKQNVIKAMEKLLDYPKEKLKERFNEICEKYLFHPKADYSHFPVINQ